MDTVALPADEQRNTDLSEQTFSYAFTTTSAVFHRYGCRLLCRSRSLQECSDYQIASDGRRPCKICKPEPPKEDFRSNVVPPTDEPLENEAHQRDLNTVVRVRLMDGSMVNIKWKNIVGFCHSKLHPGKLTKKLIETHDCLGKACPSFQKFDLPYWTSLEQNRVQKAKERKKRKQNKANVLQQEQERVERFQRYFDELNHLVIVASVVQLKPKVFCVYYVSDNRFADGMRYTDVFDAARRDDPPCRMLFRHVKDVDGHFVTREEYKRRKK